MRLFAHTIPHTFSFLFSFRGNDKRGRRFVARQPLSSRNARHARIHRFFAMRHGISRHFVDRRRGQTTKRRGEMGCSVVTLVVGYRRAFIRIYVAPFDDVVVLIGSSCRCQINHGHVLRCLIVRPLAHARLSLGYPSLESTRTEHV